MAYKRKRAFGRGRRFKRRRRSFGRGFTRRVGNYRRYSGLGGAELKFVDVFLGTQPLAAGTIFDSLNPIGQSVTENGRIGRKVVVKSLVMKYRLSVAATQIVGNTADVVRVIVYLDKQTNGAAALPGDILAQVGPLGFRELTNVGRFRILYDRRTAIHTSGGASLGGGAVQFVPSIKTLRFSKRCSVPLEFDGPLSAITALRSNNFGLLIVSVGNQIVDFEARVRIRYKDN